MVEVIATDFNFNPRRIHARPGQRLRIVVRNEGSTPHNFELELPGGERVLPQDIPSNGRAEMTVEVPAQPGEIVYYCPIADHRERGMVGTLVVEEPTTVALEETASGLTSPVSLVELPDGSGRKLVVDQIGLVRVLDPNGALAPAPFLDLRDRLVELDRAYDERGLLGLALHPDYATNGRLFVYYSAPPRSGAPPGTDNTSRLSELSLSSDASRALPTSERVILEIDQPQSNHNGGTIAFGPMDGFLYVSLGDGGGQGDIDDGHTPEIGNGQDRQNLLGSILRIDVDRGERYAIPIDNPFADGIGGAPEIWAYGFRNPYRFSFDAPPAGTGRLLAGDSGQTLWEEVSVVDRGGNYGWNILEGTHCFNRRAFDAPLATCPRVGPSGEELRWPVIEIPHASQEGGYANVIIGGIVYRGAAIPSLFGHYVFGVHSLDGSSPAGALFTARDLGESDISRELWPVRPLDIAGREGRGLARYLLGIAASRDRELWILTTDTLGPTGETGRVHRMRPPS